MTASGTWTRTCWRPRVEPDREAVVSPAVPLAAGVPRGLPRPGRVRRLRRQPAVHGRAEDHGQPRDRLPRLPRRAPGPRQAGQRRPLRLLLPAGGATAARGRAVRLACHEHDRPGGHPRGRPGPADGQRLRHPQGGPEPQVAGDGEPGSRPRLAAEGAMGLAVRPRRQAGLGITSFLTEPGTVSGPPHRLAANAGKSFIGSYVLGMGFVLEPDEAQRLIEKDPRNKDVLFPYLNGEDLNSRPDQSPSRWVINFFDWPLDRDSAPEDYEGPVAADYPDCLRSSRRRSSRSETRRTTTRHECYRETWWQYAADNGLELYRTIAGMERVLGRSRWSATKSCVCFRPNGIVSSRADWLYSIR